MNRRRFVSGLSAAAVAVGAVRPRRMFAEEETGADAGNAAPVRFGIIGPGSRGKELMRHLLRVPGVTFVAAADVYEPRFEQVDTLCGYKVARHKDYRELLGRKDLDAVIVSTPLSFHGEHVLAALDSGRHVYGEKTMAFTVEQARAIVSKAATSKGIYQVGHQYRYAPWIHEAIDRVHKGEIGDVTHVYAYWHRNNDWRRPVADPSMERLINWRLYKQYSLGLISELGSHHIDVTNWIFGEAPQEAYATGSIASYHDGRETDDNVQAVLGYSKGRRLMFSALTDNANQGNQLWVYGSRGSLNITLEYADFYYEPKADKPVPTDAKTRTQGIATGASYRVTGEMPYRGPGSRLDVPVKEDPTASALKSFVQCIRTGQKPFADAHVGLGSALGVVVANHALTEKRLLKIT